MNLALAQPDHHASDELIAEAARLAPAAQGVEMNIGAVSPAQYSTQGNWSAIIPWLPHIPVSVALLPNGRLLTYASNQRTTFPDGPQFTYAAVWDPATGLFTEYNNGRHDMFCGGLALLQDGRLMVNGGNGILGTNPLASLFDWRTNGWTPAQNMADGRWYNTSVALPSGEVFTAGGNGGGDGIGTIEQWNAGSGWRRMSGVNWQGVVNQPIPNAIEPNWHPFLVVAPDGRVAHFGPHRALNWITTTGTGSLVPAGATLPGTHYPKQGAWAMYDMGKVLVMGGLQAIDNGTVVNKAFTVDLNSTTPAVATTASMTYARSFSNSVILPNGEVMVVGGTTVGEFGSDAGTVYTPEIWNPATGTWRAVADASVPRNYHSLAMLLPDGRVWSGGGGLYGETPVDHRDAQVFTPPQLFNADGSEAARPEITAVPDRIGPGSVFTVNATPGVQYFSFIRMSSLTHSVSTDLRHLRFTHSVTSPGAYALTAPASINVLTPGYWMMFAVNASGVWSISRVVQVTNATLPVVTNPGEQFVSRGSAVSLPISASASGTLSYSATGLPAGVAINASTGVIAGTITAVPGTYSCTVLVSSGAQVASAPFSWIVVLPNLGTGQIAREWWTGIPGLTVASLTGNSLYPANPRGRDLLPSFSTPQNWDDETGQRVRGYVHAPVTGQYRFFVSSDDHSSLLLSSDDNPLNAVQIASQADYTPPQTWTWYPQQASALITLTGGARYYIEAIIKDGNGDDHLDVGWQRPGDTAPALIAGTYLSPYLPVQRPAMFWSFEEAVWNGTAGEAKASDLGIYRYGGAASGGVSPTGNSPALGGNPGTGRSAVFNGVSQSVVVPYNAALNPSDLTLAAWVRVDGGLGAERCIVASREISGTVTRGYGLWLTNTGNWQFRTGAAGVALTGPAVALGQWTHVAVTFRTTNAATRTGSRRIYVNGVLAVEDSGVYLINASKPLVFGAAESLGSAFFAGAIDEVTLHHAPLSQADMLALRDVRHATIPITQNLPPQITNPGGQSTVIGAVVSLPVTASDSENDPITFGATGLPTGLSISPTAGIISGTVTAAGTFNVVLTAADGVNPPSDVSFTWTVSNGLQLQPLVASPKAVGSVLNFTVQTSSGVNPRFKWNFGDATPETEWAASVSTTHTYAAPGRYLVTLTATDDTGVMISSAFYQAVHAALTSRKPNTSSSIAVQDLATGNDRIWCVNGDNNSISGFDVVTNARYAEVTVGTAPRALAFAPDGRLWVTNVESATISIINNTSVAATVSLPRGTRPFGIVFDPLGTAAWVALEGTGRVLKLNPSTGAQLANIDVGGPVRQLSISADGTRVYASRFVTPRVPGEETAAPVLNGAGGQVVVIGTAALAVERTLLLSPSSAQDTETSARGLPNYLGAAVISPDGLSAWVPSKQDNIQRGMFRDARPLNHEDTIRAIVSRIDLTAQAEHLASRVDIDNAGMPSAAAYDPWGIYVFTALEASREIAVLDAWTRQEIMRFPAGRAPQGVTLSPDGNRLYVQNFMDRSITVHDVSSILQGGTTAPPTLATLNAVTTERLTAQVLLGKRLFYDAKDTRLARQEYLSCASCHNDGGHDGRVWDLTGFGEGLRNTITLKGHANHGVLHWSGNFDEVHDFEGQIRDLAGGSGLISTGTPNPPLGAPNAGRSADLDALAAYVKSLTTHGNSPYRNSDGGLTADAVAGQQIFRAQNCASCHSGANFTSSALNVFANIGTIKPSSGRRLGGDLIGFDVPTLRGVWTAAPYLHDGSAATLADAVKAHPELGLTETQVGQVVSFLSQIDDAPLSAPAPLNVAIGTPSSNVTTTFVVTGTLSEAATGFTATDINVMGGTVSGFNLSGNSFSFNVTPTAAVLRIQLLAGVMTDSTGLGNIASNVLNVVNTGTIDITAPVLTLSTGSSSVSSAFTVSVNASEVVTGLAVSDFSVTNGAASSLSGGAAAYTVLITPTAAGTVSVLLPTGAVVDGAGNVNAASNTVTVTYTPPVPVPIVKIQAENFDEGGEGVAYHDTDVANIGYESSGLVYRNSGVDIEPSEDADGTPSIGWINAGEWLRYTPSLSAGTYDVNFRMATVFAGPSKVRLLINGLLVGTCDVTATGGWSAWRTFKISGVVVPSTGLATVRLEFPTGDVNFNWMEFVSTSGGTPPDTTRPTVVLSTVATSVTAPFVVTATFGENVTGLLATEFSVTNGTVTGLTSVGAVWSATVTPTAAGNVVVGLSANVAQDAAGNGNTAATSITVNYMPPDTTRPTVVLSSAATNVTAPFVVTATFSESVTGLLASEFSVTNGTVTGLTSVGAVWSATVTPTAAGNVVVGVPANVAQDAAGNGNTAAVSITVNYTPMDTTRPTVALSTAATSVTAPFIVTATFSESVAGLLASEFSVTNGAVTGLTSVGAVWSATVTPTAAGSVTVGLPANVAQDGAGNGNTAAISISVNYSVPDTIRPNVVLSTVSASVTTSFVVTATFSESVAGLLVSEFSVTNGTVIALSSAGAVWSATVTPAAAGNVIVGLPANVAQDAAGNGNLAASAVTVSYTPPPPTGNGLTADYYTGKNFEQLALSRVDSNIDFTWNTVPATGLPADGFSVRWQGSIVPTRSGVFDFITRSDDGVRLWINGVRVIDNWTNHGETWDYATLTLTAGVPVAVKMEFYENTGSAMARLFWDGPGADFVPVPQSVLRPLAGVTSSGALARVQAPANSDGDDMPDLMEQAIGTSTSSAIASPEAGLTLVQRNHSAVDAVVVRRAGLSGITFGLEASTNMVDWPSVPLQPSIVNLGDGRERLTWSNLQNIAGVSEMLGMVHLRVTDSSGVSAVSIPVAWQQLAPRTGVQSFGLNLIRAAVFTGPVLGASATGATVAEQETLAAALPPSRQWYLEVLSGPHAGHRIDLQEVTANACVFATNSSNNTVSPKTIVWAGVRVSIRPHITLGEVFDGGRFRGNVRTENADQVLFHTGTSYLTHWLFDNGVKRRWQLSGDATLADTSGTIIPPGIGVMLQINATSPKAVMLTGTARTTPFAQPLRTGYNLFANPWPVDATPTGAGMTGMAFLPGGTVATADQLQFWSGDGNAKAKGYIGYWLSRMPGQVASTWLSAIDGMLPSADAPIVLRPGRAAFIKTQPNADRPLWIVPVP